MGQIKRPTTPTIEFLGEAITTIRIALIQGQTIATTTIPTIRTATMVHVPHSNTVSDYVFYGIHTVKVLVLKRFVPSNLSKGHSWW